MYRPGHMLNKVVFMGMGEPLYNFKNVKKAIQVIQTNPKSIHYLSILLTLTLYSLLSGYCIAATIV